ncbi:uncharacterized protein LOC127251477 isoform X2 [Andrographis paniculata]|uniref:uncharacterized protein LOC127251477 isoform X2 n=1 Tax=Andrographis paniculata TaxID=175694 RepID=UPI0021E91E2B|nr:uncharacterized protein LOC127251477 isoform X2 [Andrographis paniculata]
MSEEDNGRNGIETEGEDNLWANVPKSKRLSGRAFRQFLISRAKRVKKSDHSVVKSPRPAQSGGDIADPILVDPDDTTDERSSRSGSGSGSSPVQERLDFVLRRVIDIDQGQADISNGSNQTANKILAQSAANELESTTSFVEHWVPVRLSNVQIELYCGYLFSNAPVLCSPLKHEASDFLRDTLLSIRKCCDHPYLVDSSSRTSLIQGLPECERLDAEIRLSNKLLLLYKMLLEIRNRGLRVLILYQLHEGTGCVSIGDILDDIIHEKFGKDSFVRIVGGSLYRARRREALKNFNDKGNGNFVCLMETRCCVPGVELSNIDTVVIFNSDLDPMNDLRALQKIKLDSKFAAVKIFRLYSSHTVEEKALILAKQGKSPEGNIVNAKHSMYHGMVTWGASYLFKMLDEFHNLSIDDARSPASYKDSFVEEVLTELLALLSSNNKSNTCNRKSVIVKVQQIGGLYSGNISLLGEVELPHMDNFSTTEGMLVTEAPNVFWTKLLVGRNQRWRYFSRQSPRTRKRWQNIDGLAEQSVRTDTTSKDCRKAPRTIVHGISASKTLEMLYRRNKQTKDPGQTRDGLVHRKAKHNTLALDRRVEAAQQNESDEPITKEPQSLLLPDQHSHIPSCSTSQNDHIGPTEQSVETSSKRLKSSVQHSRKEMPLQNARAALSTVEDGEESGTINQAFVSPTVEDEGESGTINQAFVSPTSLSCGHPIASQISSIEARDSVCGHIPSCTISEIHYHDGHRNSTCQLEFSVRQPTRDEPLQTAYTEPPTLEVWGEPGIVIQVLNSQPILNCENPEASQITGIVTPELECIELQIELDRLKKQRDESLKLHLDKKVELQMACEKEVDQIRKKYDMLLQNADVDFVEETRVLEARCDMVLKHKVLAEVIMKKSSLKDITVPQVASNFIPEELGSSMNRGTEVGHSGPTVSSTQNIPTSISSNI